MHNSAELISAPQPADEAALYACIDALFGRLPEARKRLSQAPSILVKPNLGGGHPNAMTSKEVLVAFCRWLRDNFDARVTVGDSSVVGSRCETTICHLGLREALETMDVSVVDLADSDVLKIPVRSGGLLGNVEVYRPALDTSLLVSLAKLKTNYATKVSLCIKNLKGIISDGDKIRFHRLGVHECLAELLDCMGHPLSLIDAVNGWDVDRSTHVGAMIGGIDALAVDWLGALLTRTDPEQVMYLTMCRDRGIGRVPDCIKQDLARSMSKPFNGPLASVAGMSLPECVVCVEGGACSGCISILQRTLKRMEAEGTISGLPPLTIALGPSAKIQCPSQEEQRLLIAMGNCCGLRREADHVIDGCPPQSRLHVQDLLESLRRA